MGWIPSWGSLWVVIPSVSAPHFVSVTPSMSILFPLLRRIKVSTLWSSIFLSFMWFENCILDILTFWANIHLSVSAYHVCCFVIGLPHSGWYFLVPSICLRISRIQRNVQGFLSSLRLSASTSNYLLEDISLWRLVTTSPLFCALCWWPTWLIYKHTEDKPFGGSVRVFSGKIYWGPSPALKGSDIFLWMPRYKEVRGAKRLCLPMLTSYSENMAVVVSPWCNDLSFFQQGFKASWGIHLSELSSFSGSQIL